MKTFTNLFDACGWPEWPANTDIDIRSCSIPLPAYSRADRKMRKGEHISGSRFLFWRTACATVYLSERGVVRLDIDDHCDNALVELQHSKSCRAQLAKAIFAGQDLTPWFDYIDQTAAAPTLSTLMGRKMGGIILIGFGVTPVESAVAPEKATVRTYRRINDLPR